MCRYHCTIVHLFFVYVDQVASVISLSSVVTWHILHETPVAGSILPRTGSRAFRGRRHVLKHLEKSCPWVSNLGSRSYLLLTDMAHAKFAINIETWLVVWNIFLFFHILGTIIPIDVHIFQRVWNHQPGNILTHLFCCGTFMIYSSGTGGSRSRLR